MEEFWKVLRAHRRLRHTFLFSLCVWVPADVVFVVRFPWNGWVFLTKSSLASYQELFCKITLLASSRPERWTRNVQRTFWQISNAFIVGLTSSNLKSECNAIVSNIVAVWSKEIIATSISSQISKGVSISYRLITYYLEFCQHRLRFITVYVNTKTSFQLLINKW